MLTVELIAPGRPAAEALRLVQRDCPPPGPGQVRIRMLARPVNPADLLLLDGRHVYKPLLPAVVGIEGAGLIEAVAEGVSLAPGTLVAVPSGGTWREQMIVPAAAVLALPPDLSIEQAATLSVNPFTASGLLQGLEPGDSVLINAAGSALARILLVLARRRGVQVIALVRSPRHREALLAQGALAVLIEGPDLEQQWRSAGLQPVRRALDAVAGAASAWLFERVAEGGDLLIYGLLDSDQVRLPAASLIFRDVRVRGYSRLRALAAMAAAERAALTEELISLVRSGLIETGVAARYPLEQAAEAVEQARRPAGSGKILLLSPDPRQPA
jgi:NADPH:quinone reductase-like Zn-dependent oxidoreductase